MKRLFTFLLALALATPAAAQIVQPTQSISVQDSGTQCSVAGTCASWALINTSPSFTVQITGTFNGTLTFRGSADNATYFDIMATKVSTGVAATTTTTTGQYAFTNPGILTLRIVGTTINSGGANITLTRGSSSSARSSSGGSGPTFNALATGDVAYASATNVVSGLADVAVGQVLVSGGVGVAPAYTASPSITGTYTQTLTALGTTSTDGIIAVNSTAATSGTTIQISPRVRLRGTAWNVFTSKTVDFFTENLPVMAATPTGIYRVGFSLDGAGATYPLTLTSAGALTVLSSVSFADNLLRGAATIYAGATATIASGFSTSAPSIAGRGSSFAVTIGATPGVTGTVNFASTFTNVPSTSCTNTITANAVQAVPTTTQVVLNGVWVQGDIIRCITLGY